MPLQGRPPVKIYLYIIWVWLEIRARATPCRSLFPFARVPFWVPIFDPEPDQPRCVHLINAISEAVSSL